MFREASNEAEDASSTFLLKREDLGSQERFQSQYGFVYRMYRRP